MENDKMRLWKKGMAGVLILSCMLTGCTKEQQQTEKVTTDSNGTSIGQEETKTAQLTQEPSQTEETSISILNNGGLYVSYQGDIYYRQYDAEDVSDTGLFAEYEYIHGTKKDMMVLHADQTTEKLFEDEGEGNLYLANGRMFLQKYVDDSAYVYTVKLDGTDEQELGEGMIQGIDEETSSLICFLTDANQTYVMNRIDTATLEITPYTLQNSMDTILTIEDGRIYYLTQIDLEQMRFGNIKMSSVKVDGTEERLLVETNENLYEGSVDYMTVPCIQIENDTVYFTYGGYAGTGHFYQGGALAKVNTNGTGFEKLTITLPDSLDGKMDESIDPTNTVDEKFFVGKEDDNLYIYFSLLSFEGDRVPYYKYEISTGKVTETDIVSYKIGDAYQADSAYYAHLSDNNTATQLLPYVPYKLLGTTVEDDYYDIDSIQIVGDTIFYSMSQSRYDEAASIGWRDGYKRIKTMTVYQKIGTDDTKVLFEY